MKQIRGESLSLEMTTARYSGGNKVPAPVYDEGKGSALAELRLHDRARGGDGGQFNEEM